MAIQQISVFVENQKGKLLGTVKTLAEAGINIRAMSIADTKDFGILRLITSDNQKAMEVLSQDSVVNTTKVIAAKMEDEAGALYKVLQILSDAQINIDDLHTPHDGTGKRTMAILTTNQLVPAVLVDRIHDAVSASRAMAITIPN